MNYDTRSKKRKYLLIAAVLTVLVVPLGMGLFLGNKDMAQNKQILEAGDEFMTALAQNDAASGYSQMTSRLQEQVGTSEEWANALSRSMGSGGAEFERVKITPVDNYGNTYEKDSDPQRIEYKVNLSGSEYEMHIVVVNDSGTLKVDEYNSVLKS